MKQRVLRTAAQAVAAAAVVIGGAIGTALSQGRGPSKSELILALWAAAQAVLTVLATALHYRLDPPEVDSVAGPWDPDKFAPQR